MKKFIILKKLILLFILYSGGINAQDKPVLITDESTINNNLAENNTKSILNLYSSKRGLLIPRMTTAQRDVIILNYQSNPDITARGLLIYNTSTQRLNYYDGIVWQELKAEEDSDFNGRVPIGGILPYTGSEENLPDNWKICNGQNGTPDLTDRFIVGMTQILDGESEDDENIVNNQRHNPKYAALGDSTGGESKHVLTPEESGLYPHKHNFDDQDVVNTLEIKPDENSNIVGKTTSTIIDVSLKTTNRALGTDVNYIRRRADSGIESEYGYTDPEHKHDASIEGTLSFSGEFLQNQEIRTPGNGEQSVKSHENEPAHYVMAFIIRMY